MEMEIKLSPAEVKKIIAEHLIKEGFILNESSISFDVSQGYNYYDQPVGYELNCVRAKVTRE